jgi:hypothetical protein
MSFLPVFEYAMFDPEVTKAMGDAFDLAKELLVGTPPAIVQECMANRIIEAAHAGERDVKRLRAAALDGLGLLAE